MVVEIRVQYRPERKKKDRKKGKNRKSRKSTRSPASTEETVVDDAVVEEATLPELQQLRYMEAADERITEPDSERMDDSEKLTQSRNKQRQSYEGAFMDETRSGTPFQEFRMTYRHRPSSRGSCSSGSSKNRRPMKFPTMTSVVALGDQLSDVPETVVVDPTFSPDLSPDSTESGVNVSPPAASSAADLEDDFVTSNRETLEPLFEEGEEEFPTDKNLWRPLPLVNTHHSILQLDDSDSDEEDDGRDRYAPAVWSMSDDSSLPPLPPAATQSSRYQSATQSSRCQSAPPLQQYRYDADRKMGGAVNDLLCRNEDDSNGIKIARKCNDIKEDGLACRMEEEDESVPGVGAASTGSSTMSSSSGFMYEVDVKAITDDYVEPGESMLMDDDDSSVQTNIHQTQVCCYGVRPKANPCIRSPSPQASQQKTTQRVPASGALVCCVGPTHANPQQDDHTTSSDQASFLDRSRVSIQGVTDSIVESLCNNNRRSLGPCGEEPSSSNSWFEQQVQLELDIWKVLSCHAKVDSKAEELPSKRTPWTTPLVYLFVTRVGSGFRSCSRGAGDTTGEFDTCNSSSMAGCGTSRAEAGTASHVADTSVPMDVATVQKIIEERSNRVYRVRQRRTALNAFVVQTSASMDDTFLTLRKRRSVKSDDDEDPSSSFFDALFMMEPFKPQNTLSTSLNNPSQKRRGRSLAVAPSAKTSNSILQSRRTMTLTNNHFNDKSNASLYAAPIPEDDEMDNNADGYDSDPEIRHYHERSALATPSSFVLERNRTETPVVLPQHPRQQAYPGPMDPTFLGSRRTNMVELVQECLNYTWALQWHRPYETPVQVRAWMERGSLLNEGETVVEPKIMWHDFMGVTSAPEDGSRVSRPASAASNMTTDTVLTQPHAVRMLNACRILSATPSSLDREVYPFARSTHSFWLKTVVGETYLMEASTSVERDSVVQRWKLVVARLAALAVLEDMESMSDEFFSPAANYVGVIS